jgi:hypothetical protein
MNKYILLSILISFLGEPIYSQPTFKENIKDYENICFCEVGLSHPMRILNLDNNLEILFALKTGQTLYGLDKLNIKYTGSQINLLEYAGLISRKDSIYRSLIPILSKSETSHLRKGTKKLAVDIISQFKDDFECLSKTMNSQGLQKNSYSLFFAFVLDGLVWDILEQNNDIEATTITKEKPFWDGTFWMTDPLRDFSCGTNCLSSGDFSINVNWSDQSVISVSSYKMLRELLNDYKANGKVTKPEIFKEFAKNDLFNEDGELRIPVIKADSTDVIYCQSKNIAQKVVGYIKNIDYTKILSNCKYLTKGQKITILYHEMMWDILNVMESNGQIKKPVVFGNPIEAQDSDLKYVIFIVKGNTLPVSQNQ